MNPPCPRCNSALVVKNGRIATGEQKYECRSCYKGWHEGSKLQVRTGRPCYYCGKAMVKKGKHRGVQRYQCCGVIQSDNVLDKAEVNYYWKEHTSE